MIKDYWYIIALGIVSCIICISIDSLIPFFLYCCWIIILTVLKKITVKFVLITICFSGFMMYYLPPPYPDTSNNLFVDEGNQIVTGNINSSILETEKKLEFEVIEGNGQKSLVTYFKNNQEADNDKPQYGANCILHGKKSIPNHATNPHQFDYQEYLWKKGITAQLIIETMDDMTCQDPTIMASIYSFRDFLQDTTKENLSVDTIKWLHALVLGDDSLLDQEIIDLFQKWGLSHILAISGLHIGIIVGLIYFVLIRLSITTKEKAQLFILIFLPIYAVIGGGQPSVWRASIMVLLVILISFFKWRLSYTDIISITFIALIMLNKFIIYHIGFQLSFAVTFGIILSRKWLSISKSKTESIFKISFVSQMMILPLQLHYFSVFEPLSILLNIIIVPYFSLFVIPAMFAFLLLMGLPSNIIGIADVSFHFMNDAVLGFIFWVDDHMYFPFIIGKLSPYFVIIYYVLFILLMMSLERDSRIKAMKYGIILSLYIAFLGLRPYFSPYGTVTMLDIGQGDAIIIEMPYRQGVYFIDIGAQVSFPDFTGTDKEYRQVIRPYLYGQGISKIDAVFLSHEDLDHYGSLTYLMEDMKVGEVIISNYYEINVDNYNQWEKKVGKVRRVKWKDKLMHNGQEFYVISPYTQTDSANENSLVLYTEIGGLGWLFTGDIGKETEQQIVKRNPELNYDVLKVAHHGSNTSTDKALVDNVNDVALISVGENNSYGHPTKEVIDTLENGNLTIYRTDMDGAIQFYFRKNRGYFTIFDPQNKRKN